MPFLSPMKDQPTLSSPFSENAPQTKSVLRLTGWLEVGAPDQFTRSSKYRKQVRQALQVVGG
jgi:hypothetical protein